jgi:4-amino-4-deoxy-L-arabinose transferase-like glycosyltransferase
LTGSALQINLRLQLKNGFIKWRLALLIVIIVYAIFLLQDLGYMSIQWDEAPHLYGGLLLTRGHLQEYISTYGYYPPLYDLLTTGFFGIFGATAASGRLVAVTFSLLTVWLVFEFANRAYGPKTALISSIMLGIMPGFFWVSRVAMLETILMSFFSLSLFFFLSWIRFHKNKTLILCGLTLGAGFLAKYQILVAGLVMIVALLLFYRKKLRARSKFLLLPIIALLVVMPWVFIVVQKTGAERFGELLYVIQEGGQDRAVYSSRFPAPIFYLIEMTWPFNDIPVHPISLPIYILGLLGLGLWAYRRKTEDKFFLIWFIVVYVFFTLVPNKQWRYVTPLFPVLAISAASFIMFIYTKLTVSWKRGQTRLNKQKTLKVAAGLFVVLAASAVVYSSYEAYQMVARDQIHVPIDEATAYATSHISQDESIVLLSPFNLFNQDMVRFYLPAQFEQEQVFQYPELPIDSFASTFNVSELVALCVNNNVKYVFLYEHADVMEVYMKLNDTGRFTYEHVVGDVPHSISILSFN